MPEVAVSWEIDSTPEFHPELLTPDAPVFYTGVLGDSGVVVEIERRDDDHYARIRSEWVKLDHSDRRAILNDLDTSGRGPAIDTLFGNALICVQWLVTRLIKAANG